MKDLFSFMYKGKISITIIITSMILSLVPLSVAVASYFITARDAIQVSANRHLEALSDWQVRLVRDWLNSHMQPVRMVAGYTKERWTNINEINNILLKAKEQYPEYGSLAFADASGKVIADTTGITGFSVADREYFIRGQKGQEYTSEMMIARTYKLPCLAFSVPIMVNGIFKGVVIGTVDANSLNNIMGFHMGKTGESFLVDKNGMLITIPKGMLEKGLDKSTLIPAPKSIALEKGLKGNSGTTSYKDYRGITNLCVYKWIPEYKILLITKQDDEEALNEAGGASLKKSMASGIILIVLILPIAWFSASRISKPLEEIAFVVDQISTGNLKARVKPMKTNHEISNLGRQINELADTLDRSMAVIKDQIAELENQKEEIIAQKDDILHAYDKLTRANQDLQQLAITDQLTQTYNRRYFMDRLRSEVLLSFRTRRPLAVVLIDIDHFKNINDTYGHKVGDQVLQGIVKIVISLVRRSDLLARFGGEEFIILAPETNLAGALNLAEKIRAGVEEHVFVVDGDNLHVTISLGVAELKDYVGSPEKIEDNLILTADHYLYEAKRLGRNRVEGGA